MSAYQTIVADPPWQFGDKLPGPGRGAEKQVRMEHETCLIGTRGRPEALSRSIRSTFEAPVGRHSEKPDAFFEIVEQLSPGPYIELFARKRRDGWDAVGDEL